MQYGVVQNEVHLIFLCIMIRLDPVLCKIRLDLICFLSSATSDALKPTQTRWYRAPELLVGAPYGFEVDIWAVGE